MFAPTSRTLRTKMVSPTIVAAIVTIVFGVIATLIGLAYRNLLKRVRDLEDDTETRQGKHNSLSDKVDTLWRWAFGVPEDETDTGLSGDIQEGFNNIEEELEQTQAKQEEYHTKEMDALDTLVNEIHDEDNIDIERGDVFDDQ